MRRVLFVRARSQAGVSSLSDVMFIAHSALTHRRRGQTQEALVPERAQVAAHVLDQFDMSSPMYLTSEIDSKGGSRGCATKAID